MALFVQLVMLFFFLLSYRISYMFTESILYIFFLENRYCNQLWEMIWKILHLICFLRFLQLFLSYTSPSPPLSPTLSLCSSMMCVCYFVVVDSNNMNDYIRIQNLFLIEIKFRFCYSFLCAP